MVNEQKIEQSLRWLIFPVLLVVFLAQAYSCRGIYADGGNFLLAILTSEDLPWWDKQRIVNHLITKTPVVVAIKLGVRNLVVLRYFFSTWLLLCPLLVWGATLWTLKHDRLFWPFVLFFSFVYYNTCFFSIGEYNLCFALVAYCLAQLLRPLPTEFWARAGLLEAALLLSFNYPTTLFAGSLLLVLTFIKPKKEWNGVSENYRALLMILLVLSVGSALWEVVYPRDPNNYAGAHDTLVLHQDVQFWCVLVFGTAAFLSFFARRQWQQAALIVICGLSLIKLYFDPFRHFPYLHYALRLYMSLAVSACGILLWWFQAFGQRFVRAPARKKPLLPSVMSMVLFLFLSAFDIQMSLNFRTYLENFQGIIDRSNGIVSFGKSGLAFIPYNNEFMWAWTMPLLSLILRDGSGKGIVVNPANYRGYQPFDPYVDIPDLDRYYR